MSAFLQQLPALIGVVIGALGSYWAVARGDRVRFRREREARWEERRLAVYTDYARALKKSVTLTYRVAAGLGNDPHPHPLTPEEAAPLIAEATVARDPYGEALLLLGDPEVVAKAREWVTTCWRWRRSCANGPGSAGLAGAAGTPAVRTRGLLRGRTPGSRPAPGPLRPPAGPAGARKHRRRRTRQRRLTYGRVATYLHVPTGSRSRPPASPRPGPRRCSARRPDGCRRGR